MGFMMPKPPKPPPAPPPPPTAPDMNMMNRQRAFDMRGALGGTFLTAGQKLGTSNAGKSLLGQ